MNLIQELLKQQLVSKEKSAELEDKVEKSGDTQEEVILKEKIMPEDDLFNLKAKVLNLPFFKINKDQEF